MFLLSRLWESPFGLLNPLHHYLIRNAAWLGTPAETPLRWLAYIGVPFGIATAQVYYLLAPNAPSTQPLRKLLGAIGVVVSVGNFLSFRCGPMSMNGFNMGNTMNLLMLVFKHVHFALSTGIRDPWMARGRSRAVAAVDLVLNSRMISISTKDTDLTKPPPVQPQYFHLARGWRPSTRWDSVSRHLAKTAIYGLAADTVLAILRAFPSLMTPGHGVFDTFLAHTRLTLFGAAIPTFAVGAALQASLCAMILTPLAMSYHAVAAVTIASGLWEPNSWDVNMIGDAIGADSLHDLWGKEWHQIHRFQFSSIAAALIPHSASPAVASSLSAILPFFISATVHVIGCLPMSPAPPAWATATVFVLSGFGCALESLYRRATGKRVGGWAGRIWVWSFMIAASRPTVTAWVDAGHGATARMQGIMDPVVGWIFKNVFVVQEI